MLQDEYYVIESENNDNYPLFSWDQNTIELGLGLGKLVGLRKRNISNALHSPILMRG